MIVVFLFNFLSVSCVVICNIYQQAILNICHALSLVRLNLNSLIFLSHNRHDRQVLNFIWQISDFASLFWLCVCFFFCLLYCSLFCFNPWKHPRMCWSSRKESTNDSPSRLVSNFSDFWLLSCKGNLNYIPTSSEIRAWFCLFVFNEI